MVHQNVTFRSSDGSIFTADRKALEVTTRGFPPSDLEGPADEIIELSEDSATLKLFFKFTAPADNEDSELPDLDNLTFEVILPLAEAAEKYQVNALRYICRRRMRSFDLGEYQDSRNAVKYRQLVLYAAEHGYPEVLDQHLGRMLRVSFEDIQCTLPQKYLIAWAKYNSNWKDIIIDFSTRQFLDVMKKKKGNHELGLPLQEFVKALKTISAFRDIYRYTMASQTSPCPIGGLTCDICSKNIAKWKKSIIADVVNLPKFTDLVNGTGSM